MKIVNDLIKEVNKIQNELKRAKVNPSTQNIINYEVSNVIQRLKSLYDLIVIDKAVSKITIWGEDGYFIGKNETLKVRELAEQHYIEEENEDE